MKIAYTMALGKGDTDLLLARVAEHLQMEDVRVCGTVQINAENKARGRCDMDVKILPDGPIIRISQSLGRDARGCRLDSAALEDSVGLTKTELDKGAQLLIINKFGKQEAEGSGFRDVIADACSNGIPVLVGLNDMNKVAFLEFTDNLAVSLPAHLPDILEWIGRALIKDPDLAGSTDPMLSL